MYLSIYLSIYVSIYLSIYLSNSTLLFSSLTLSGLVFSGLEWSVVSFVPFVITSRLDGNWLGWDPFPQGSGVSLYQSYLSWHRLVYIVLVYTLDPASLSSWHTCSNPILPRINIYHLILPSCRITFTNTHCCWLGDCSRIPMLSYTIQPTRLGEGLEQAPTAYRWEQICILLQILIVSWAGSVQTNSQV